MLLRQLTAVFLLIGLTSAKSSPPTDFSDSEIIPYGERHVTAERAWRSWAMGKLWEERKAMKRTPLIAFKARGYPKVQFLFKDETQSRTQTVKHRSAWSLLAWAVMEDKVHKWSAVYDSTTGNAAASMAYMCKLLKIPFHAFVPRNLEKEKVGRIQEYGGIVKRSGISSKHEYARKTANSKGGFFINQYGNAQEAEESHDSGNFHLESTNILREVLLQMDEDHSLSKKVPDYFVHAADTGGTITSIGRYAKRYNLNTTILLSDSEYSLFYDYIIWNRFEKESGMKYWKPPGIAEIGAGYDEQPLIYRETTSLDKRVIDEILKMPDIATTAALYILRDLRIGGGPSTALNFLVSLYKAYQLKDKGKIGDGITIATIIGDPADMYKSTYFNSDWINEFFGNRGGMKAVQCWRKVILDAIETGSDFLAKGRRTCGKRRKSTRTRGR